MGYHRAMDLKTLYDRLSEEQREALAARVDINPAYLRQLATGWVRPQRGKRVRPSLELIQRLVEADKRLKTEHLVREFAS
jgi:hypothetical protein